LQQTLDLTVFMVTHHLEGLRTVCDRIAAVADGTMVAIGTLSEVRQSSHPWVEAYFRGKRNHVLARAPGITGA
jgi:phospholipid/cholesterol/gamma-HCH transport system ATP-binding protein